MGVIMLEIDPIGLVIVVAAAGVFGCLLGYWVGYVDGRAKATTGEQP